MKTKLVHLTAIPCRIARQLRLKLGQGPRISQAYVAKLWPEAQAAEIKRETFARAFADVGEPDPLVLKMASNQPEFTSTTSQYLLKAVTPARIETGRRMLGTHARLLSAIEAKYGVDRHILVAIWGMESNFGQDKGSMGVMRSLATLAYHGARRRLCQAANHRGAQNPAERRRAAGGFSRLVGGSHGPHPIHPHVLSRLRRRLDGRRGPRHLGLGSRTRSLRRRIIWRSRAGRRRGPGAGRWRFRQNFDRSLIGRARPRQISEWKKIGVTADANGRFGEVDSKAFIIVPQGLDGPAFLVTQNFNAIMAYNESHSYAIAVGHLADRIRGMGPIVAPWPDQNIELSFAERVEMQKRLIGHGFATGGTDGRFGARTYEAILAFQKSRRLRLDGIPTRALLVELRKGS